MDATLQTNINSVAFKTFYKARSVFSFNISFKGIMDSNPKKKKRGRPWMEAWMSFTGSIIEYDLFLSFTLKSTFLHKIILDIIGLSIIQLCWKQRVE